MINPGELKQLMLESAIKLFIFDNNELSKDDFTYYDTNDSKFVVEDGEYIIEVGASSRDIRLTEEVSMDGKKENFPCTDLQSYYDGSFNDLDFSKLLYQKEICLSTDTSS